MEEKKRILCGGHLGFPLTHEYSLAWNGSVLSQDLFPGRESQSCSQMTPISSSHGTLQGWAWSWWCCASCRALFSFWKWVFVAVRDVPEQGNNQPHRLCSLLSQPGTIPALIAAFMCFIVCFITTSRVKANLHHSSGINPAKEDTSDAPVFLSLSSHPPQIFARNKNN